MRPMFHLRPPAVEPAPPLAEVVLAVRNGARFLPQQMDSLFAQTGVRLRLRALDDGSSDGSRQVMVDQAGRAGQVLHLAEGPRAGVAEAFFTLLDRVGADADLIAPCDQDDVWLPRKLARAGRALAALPTGCPGAVIGARMVTDAGLRPLGRDPAWRRPPGFANALVENIVPGNALVMNAAALALVRASLPAARAAGVPLHDWWIYLVLSGAGANLWHDPEPMVLYRQHGGNKIGGAPRGLRRGLRMLAALDGRYRRRIDANLSALLACADLLTPENRRLLWQFAALRAAPPARRLAGAFGLGLYRQGRAAQAALRVGLALGRA